MKTLFLLLTVLLVSSTMQAYDVVKVTPHDGDITSEIQAAIDEAGKMNSKVRVVELQDADYHLYRRSSTHKLYHISNTTSEEENPDQTKHIGLYLKNLENIIIDGKGARLVLHGEMTSFILDGCRNIKLKNFTLTYADPTVVEMTVLDVGDHYLTVRVHPQTQYDIIDGVCTFKGESWSWSKAIAQIYDPQRDVTWRSWCPLNDALKVIECEKGVLRFEYDERPEAVPGMVFQLRDSYRDEVCGLIRESKDVLLENIHFAFTGNFGIVGQMSENITCRNLVFEPEISSGRTCSGFADFVQMSGCKGKIIIENSRFVGAQDDPINIHGTHLKVVGFLSDSRVKVRYMHSQTYGFQQFHPGDEIDFIDPHTLIPSATVKVKDAVMENDREIIITLDRSVAPSLLQQKELVLENVTYTPEVLIRNNYFSRVPTRGILVTTRRKVVIEKNVFFRMRMSGVHISDDARSWYESGMVRDVIIRDNKFIECGSPVVSVAPENDRNAGFVHSNIAVKDNTFVIDEGLAVSARSVDGLNISGNTFITNESVIVKDLIRISDCVKVKVNDNMIKTSIQEYNATDRLKRWYRKKKPGIFGRVSN